MGERMAGPLSDVRILELAGLGALPYGSLRLADMGADVIRIDRVAEVPAPADRTAKPYSSWDRGRRSIAVDLKSPAGVETVLRLVDEADVFLEAFRPGVTERLGLGPEEVLGRKVHLFLEVKSRPGWLDEKERFDAMGLDFSDGT